MRGVDPTPQDRRDNAFGVAVGIVVVAFCIGLALLEWWS